MGSEKDQASGIEVQREKLRQKLDAQTRWALKPTAICLAALGLAILALWYLTNDESMMSMLLSLMGVSLLAIAIILYFFTPNRYLRDEVYNAMCETDVVSIRKILSSLLINSRGIYLPAKQAGSTKLFIPLSDSVEGLGTGAFPVAGAVFNVSDKNLKGILLDPPGQGLFLYTQRIGAYFTPEGLESEIKDVMENGLELVAKVSVKTGDGLVQVELNDIACRGMCESIRETDPVICSQTGCPVCSLVGCMVADGLGRKVRIKDVDVSGRKIRLIIETVGD
jgi:hypothetical protein